MCYNIRSCQLATTSCSLSDLTIEEILANNDELTDVFRDGCNDPKSLTLIYQPDCVYNPERSESVQGKRGREQGQNRENKEQLGSKEGTFWETVRFEDVKIAVNRLKNGKSPGIDEIRLEIIKYVGEQGKMIVSAYTLHKLVKNVSSLNVQQVTECLRSLRNDCATCSDVQNSLRYETSVLQDVCSAINAVLSMPKSEECILCLRIGVQFLGNFIVNNVENQKEVWSQCSSLLRHLLLFEDSKLNDYCAMVLYNIVLGNPEIKEEIVSANCVEAICCIGVQGSEFALYLMERLVCQEGILEKIYGPSTPEHRLFILEVIDTTLKSESIKLPASVFLFLSSEFRQTSDNILKTATTVDLDDIEPEEVVKLLEVFAHASREERYLVILQDDTSLFVTCAYLLKSMHEIGKSDNNCFSPVQKLSAITSSEPDLKQHPAYGFKASLVSVLGNMCWKHRKNQDLIRTVECIPLLLDCCNVDARNPFIIQWVVLAIRNICDGNQENQNVIAGMNREGIVTAAVLEELGITLHADEHDNKIRIVPLKQ